MEPLFSDKANPCSPGPDAERNTNLSQKMTLLSLAESPSPSNCIKFRTTSYPSGVETTTPTFSFPDLDPSVRRRPSSEKNLRSRSALLQKCKSVGHSVLSQRTSNNLSLNRNAHFLTPERVSELSPFSIEGLKGRKLFDENHHQKNLFEFGLNRRKRSEILEDLKEEQKKRRRLGDINGNQEKSVKDKDKF